MKILPINSNQNKANFRGTVDKSVVRYLNEVRYNALNRPEAFFGKIEKRIAAETYAEVKTMIEVIISKLNDFMSKTHSKTNFFLSEFSENRNIRIENKDLDICIMGGFAEPKNSIQNVELIAKAPIFPGSFEKISHSFSDLENFYNFTTALTEKIKPEEIDGALFDKKVAEVVKQAEETAPKNRLKNRKAFNNLDRLAPKFHRQPIYTEQFHIIQALAYKMQEERAKDPVEQSKEELKNLKIK